MTAIQAFAKRWALGVIAGVAGGRSSVDARRTRRGFQPAADGLPKRIAPAVFVPPPSDYGYGY